MSARRSSGPRSKAGAPRLRDRRRQSRHRLFVAALVLVGACTALLTWGFNQSLVRISSVEVQGADALLPGSDPVALAKGAMVGKYLGLIPRDSTFFIPERRIRSLISAAHPEVAAVSFAHDGLAGLIIRLSLRTAVGRWCGVSPAPPIASTSPVSGMNETCYFYDPSGFIYAVADASSSAPTLDPFTLYAPLATEVGQPIGSTIARAAELPEAFAFARRLLDFGSPVATVVIRDDEADFLLASGTRVTYVLGQEQAAYTALASAKADLDLASGAFDYVDLRFPGRVYVKKR